MNKVKRTHDHIPLTEVEERLLHKLSDSRIRAEQKFPLGFGLAASFGLVATFYGFEGLINKIDWLNNNPWAVLGVGVAILLVTGTAYRKLN
jgi:hypothetical protein